MARWIRSIAPTQVEDAVHVFMHPNTNRRDAYWSWRDHFTHFKDKLILDGSVEGLQNWPLVVDVWGAQIAPEVLQDLHREFDPPCDRNAPHVALHRNPNVGNLYQPVEQA